MNAMKKILALLLAAGLCLPAFSQRMPGPSEAVVAPAIDSSGHSRFLQVDSDGRLTVAGTFWQETQPVSISVMPSTPVTGVFWQATQPVSGTFWQVTQPVSGTFWPSVGQVAAASSQSVTLSNENVQDLNITGQATQTAAGQNIILATAGIGSTDATGYRSISIQIVPTGTVSSGVVTFEGSNDNTTFVAVPLYDEASLTTNPISTVSPATGVNRFFEGPLSWRYTRARISTVIGGGGSIQAFTRLMQITYQSERQTVTQATAANLATTATIASGTVTTVSTVTTLANGQTAHSSASTGSPVRVGGRVNTAVDTTLAANDASDLFVTTGGAVTAKPYAVPEVDWQYATPIASPITNTTAVALKAAGAAGVRNYVTAIQIYNSSATVSSIVTIQDDTTVIWTGYVPAVTAALVLVPLQVTFPTPLRGTAAKAMNFVVNTTGANVFVSAQGYQAP